MNEGLARERDLAQRLRRMRWSATALLAAMAALFAGVSVLLPRYPGLGAVRAFAEAALIGGLADWFAVSALFRHPLGLPIPHTAIVPARKNDIGRALARFVRDHFLVREAIEMRLERTDLAARLGSWLEQERNAALVSRDLATALDWLLRGMDGNDLRAAFGSSLRTAFDQLPISAVFATLIDVLTSGAHAQTLIDQLVQFGRAQLENHRVDIRVRIHDRSPWWLPKFVDQEIYDQLMTELERILNDIAADPAHPARAEFSARLKSLQHSLAADPELIAKSRGLQNEFVEHPAVRAYASDLWLRLREDAHAALHDPESALRSSVQREIRNIGATLRQDAQAAEHLNRWLRQFLVYLVETYRNPLSEIISETIERWDPSATAKRIELHIGSDLQFIRINGTLVGGLVGLSIYAIWQALVV
ncbi:MAG TPA: DUF445 domain-containing protein [Gammaproteobacteria bacterium]|nr:DUF445 domain-containing protein [Gammaproteobacteria bacterium]